jgi:hypothetical protein
MLTSMIAEEWHWRGNRRLFCQDDWKSNPPWGTMRNDYMAQEYYRDRENQYIWDYKDEKYGVP